MFYLIRGHFKQVLRSIALTLTYTKTLSNSYFSVFSVPLWLVFPVLIP
ncbi:hypothetical protein GXM_03263 [Nostoc sphaeroides CCNUC1]|uniref:Uncharacterized protein n=1 Tax=Nostoc sphaeroides CCNUC1 TaxID=2653204 RepID=A0A5P8W0I4_9NOSO|nr:hypothetical protein GXM_03263 [Nostoc sphaeroides CCNUC1]